MRIIAGEFRGRRLAAPPGDSTRPMLDRVREALFSTLGGVVDEARVLDLFAGSGSLGLEALSRGATSVRAIERDRRALAALRKNVEALAAGDRVEVVVGDALDSRRWGESAVVDLAFLDPPYPLLRDRRGRRDLLAALARLADGALVPGGWMVLHTHPRDLREEDLGAGWEVDRREYGNTALWYLRRA